MSKRLEGMADLVKQPGASSVLPATKDASSGVQATPRERTAPGSLAGFLRSQSQVFEEVDILRERLKEFDGSTPARYLDPRRIKHSHWANRSDDSFSTAEFTSFKEEIKLAGGNIQAILVRPLTGEADPLFDYELAFGHRRHRACLELGLDVLALTEALTDAQLFEKMDRENRQRADLRPYEQGEMYRKAIDEGLYPSIRAMANAIGVPNSTVAVAIQVARLPSEVLDAFPSRLDIQYRWAPTLAEALQKHPEELLARAKQVGAEQKLEEHRLGAAAVFERLCAKASKSGAENPRKIEAGGRVVATSKVVGGRYSIAFNRNALSPAQITRLESHVAKLFSS
ncbi:MAG: ParB/RepB/Spo0J family partition protein [Candidatus Saccharibacteria bacterium]|nr:ParB/RepB/Spo0J family partition protein [Rhodoferax sp.]